MIRPVRQTLRQNKKFTPVILRRKPKNPDGAGSHNGAKRRVKAPWTLPCHDSVLPAQHIEATTKFRNIPCWSDGVDHHRGSACDASGFSILPILAPEPCSGPVFAEGDVLVIGVVAIYAGRWQIKHGKRSKALFSLLVGLAAFAIVMCFVVLNITKPEQND